MREAVRGTAPIKAPSPPPTIPSLILPPLLVSPRPSMAMLASSPWRGLKLALDWLSHCPVVGARPRVHPRMLVAYPYANRRNPLLGIAPSVENCRQDPPRPSSPVREPEREAAQNPEFAVRFALPEQRQRVDVERTRRNPKPELPHQQARDVVSIGNCVGQGEMWMKLVEDVRVAPSIEVVGLTKGQALRPSVFAPLFHEWSAQLVKSANDARLERPQFFQRALGPQSDKREPMAGFNDAHAQFADVERRGLACELGDPIEQISDIEVQAQQKRRLQGGVKAVASRVAGHAPPGVWRVAFEREPFARGASERVAANHVATETPQVALRRRRKIERIAKLVCRQGHFGWHAGTVPANRAIAFQRGLTEQ